MIVDFSSIFIFNFLDKRFKKHIKEDDISQIPSCSESYVNDFTTSQVNCSSEEIIFDLESEDYPDISSDLLSEKSNVNDIKTSILSGKINSNSIL